MLGRCFVSMLQTKFPLWLGSFLTQKDAEKAPLVGLSRNDLVTRRFVSWVSTGDGLPGTRRKRIDLRRVGVTH